MDWIDVGQDRNMWGAVVNALMNVLMNVLVPQNA